MTFTCKEKKWNKLYVSNHLVYFNLFFDVEILEKDERLEDGIMQVLLRIGWLGLNSIFCGLLAEPLFNLLLSKNWFLKAKCLDTCMGIGTIIFVADMLEFDEFFSAVLFPVSDVLFPFPPLKPDEVMWHPPVFILFHLARLFWNQIFICTSLSPNLFANSDLSFNVRYFLERNSCSNSCNW